MSYNFPHSRAYIPIIEDGVDTADTLVTWKPGRNMSIVAVAFFITTVIAADTISPVLSITYDSVERDTITLTEADAVGEEIAGAGASTMPFDVAAGESITLAVKTAGTDSSSVTGQGYWVIYYQEIPS